MFVNARTSEGLMKYILMMATIEDASYPMHERSKYERSNEFSSFKYIGAIEIKNHC